MISTRLTTAPREGLPPAKHSPTLGRKLPVLCVLAAAAAGLAGCGSRDLASRLQFATPRPAIAASAPVTSNDPVVAFAARARPGQDERVTLESGQTASVRVVRAYHAASGRECREVLVGTGLEERQRLVCAAETGWVDARPLLRGGAGQR